MLNRLQSIPLGKRAHQDWSIQTVANSLLLFSRPGCLGLLSFLTFLKAVSAGCAIWTLRERAAQLPQSASLARPSLSSRSAQPSKATTGFRSPRAKHLLRRRGLLTATSEKSSLRRFWIRAPVYNGTTLLALSKPSRCVLEHQA